MICGSVPDFWGSFSSPSVCYMGLLGRSSGSRSSRPCDRFLSAALASRVHSLPSVAVLFSLFAAFLANDVQHRAAEAQQAVLREANGIRTILRLSEALGAPGVPLKSAVVSYGRSVLKSEWPTMQRQGKPVEDLDAFRNLT